MLKKMYVTSEIDTSSLVRSPYSLVLATKEVIDAFA